MPPPLLILHDPLQQIVARLPNTTVDNSVLSKARQELRLLATRVSVGQLGPGDGLEARAAAVLEHTARKAGHRIPLKHLAAAVSIKLDPLTKLHQVIGNYLSNNNSQQPANNHKKRTRDSVPERRIRSTRTTATTTSSNQMVWKNDWSLLLAAQSIRDPHGTAKSAHRLWKRIQHAIQSWPFVHERRGLLYDWARYQAAYQAACVYIICNQGDPDVVLELEDLVQASNDFTFLELQQVTRHVQQLMERMDSETKTSSSTTTSAGPRQTKKKDAPVVAAGKNKKKKKRAIVHEDKIADDSLSLRDNDIDDSSKKNPTVQQDDDQLLLLQQWAQTKQAILAQACQQAKQRSATDLSEAQALEQAANHVLERYGLLSCE